MPKAFIDSPLQKAVSMGGGDTVKNELEIHECGGRCIAFGRTDYSIIFLLLECGMMSRGKMPHLRSLAGIAPAGGSLATTHFREQQMAVSEQRGLSALATAANSWRVWSNA